MPSYCSIITEVNNIPSEPEMEFFKPYFHIVDGATELIVKIKVPSDCYYISNDNNQPPSGGPCGGPSDLQHTIDLDQRSGCSNTNEMVLSKTLNYREDPTGEKLIIYVVDKSNGGNVEGGSKSFKKVKL